MNKKYLILTGAVLLAAFLFYQFTSTSRIYRTAVSKRLEQAGKTSNPVITVDDIIHLPEPVQKYLRYTGVIGTEKLRNVKIVFEGEMRQNPKQKWMKFSFEQYSFFDNPARFFYIHGNMFGIPTVGLDSYRNGKGNMLIRIGYLIPVVDAKGSEMDTSALVTYFNDLCCFMPSVLIDRRIEWETIESLVVKATFTDRGRKVSGILYFNEKGELINFVTDDRYYSPFGKNYQKMRWSTPVGNYQEFEVAPGYTIKAPTGEAIWHFKEGEFCYARFTKIKEIEYNCKIFK